jgi:ABC-type transporter Mla subunit MlaD
MQASQVKEQFPRIQRSIDQAAQLCQTTNQVPEDLRNCIAQLDQEGSQANEMLAQETNDNKIIECVDRLEKLGDRALQACKQAGNTVDEDVQSAVKQAHDEIADLKHRLH